jgi:hypothetical protein
MAGLVPAIHALLKFDHEEWFRLFHEQSPTVFYMSASRVTLFVDVMNIAICDWNDLSDTLQ